MRDFMKLKNILKLINENLSDVTFEPEYNYAGYLFQDGTIQEVEKYHHLEEMERYLKDGAIRFRMGKLGSKKDMKPAYMLHFEKPLSSKQKRWVMKQSKIVDSFIIANKISGKKVVVVDSYNKIDLNKALR